MPSSDYSNAVGGGLKLKGAKDAGVKKHKKKKKTNVDLDESTSTIKDKTEQSVEKFSAQRALAEEEEEVDNEIRVQQQEADVKEYGKTEAQRRHEERRKKRVFPRSRAFT